MPGELKISVNPNTYVTGSGTLIDAVFAVNGDVATTSLSGSLTLTNDEICDNTRTFDLDLPVQITKVVENANATISLSDFRAEQNAIAAADLVVSGLRVDAEVRELDITLDWDHDLLTLDAIDQNGLQSANWRIDRFNGSPTQVRLHVTATNGEVLTNGTLARLSFRTFLSDTNATAITVATTMSSNRKCPLVLTVDESVAQFNTELLCGEGLLLDAMAGRALGAQITPNPSTGTFKLDLPRGTEGQVVILDALGHEVYRWELKGDPTKEIVLPAEFASGSYMLRITAGAQSQNLPLLIQK